MSETTPEASRNKIVVKLFNNDSSKLVEEELKLLEMETRKKSLVEYSTVFIAVMAVLVGSFSEVTGKIMTYPMGNYSPLMGIPNAIIYLIVYSFILWIRIMMGYVPASQLYNVWRWNGGKKSLNIQSQKLTCLQFWEQFPSVLFLISSLYSIDSSRFY
jgi:hypothetical protein